MADIHIRKAGATGRITLDRPKALNALTYPMCLAIEAALDRWRADAEVKMVLIDAAGERAFCAGGDIADMYKSGMAGNFDYGRKFWRDEYRMNAKLFEFPKPVASFMQGFTMGGGVGVGCHASHRVLGETSQIAMPECGIGLVPDVGGSYLLAQAPGRLGEYLGTTGARMGPGDAIFAGFADYFIPQAQWPALIDSLAASGDWSLIDAAAQAAPPARLRDLRAEIDRNFAGEGLGDITRALAHDDSDFAAKTLKTLRRNAPLSMACTIEMVRRLRHADSIRRALELEYRFTSRAMEHADFLEGIRAAIIDKDRTPKWKNTIEEDLTVAVAHMLAPLPKDAPKVTFDEVTREEGNT